MPTVIDELVVRVGLDNKQYKKKSAETKADFKQTKREAQKAAFGISDALRVVGLIAGGKYLANLATKTIDTNASLTRLSTNLGTMSSAMNAWGQAVEVSGGDAKGFQNTIAHLSREFTNLKITGQSGLIPFLRILKADIVDSTGKALPFEQVLRNIGAGLRAIPDRADAFNIAQQMGIDEGTFNLLMQSDAALNEIVAKMKERNGLDEQGYKNLERLDRKWRDIKSSVVAASDAVVGRMLPDLEAVTDEVIGINDTMAKNGFWAAAKRVASDILPSMSDFNEFVGKIDELRGGRSESSTPSGKRQPRAIRNFNPGNLNYAGQAGATREDGEGRFAKFGSMVDGVSALAKQLRLYEQRGINTVKSIIEKYAPPSENNTKSYIRTLAASIGVGENDVLNLDNFDTMKALIRGISKIEAGTDFLSERDIKAGVSRSTVSIGAVNVYTQATDAKGVARDIRGELAQQADYGLR